MGMTFVLLIMAIVYLPILLLVFLSFNDGLAYYVQLFTTTEYMSAVGNTLLIAVVASLIATIIASMAATGILYLGKRTRAITMAVNQLPVINADIVTSFGLVLLFVSVGMTNMGLLKLLLAHILIALPFCLLTILPKMRQLDANLIDAALDLGASPFKAFSSVIIPQLVPAMIQAFLLGFTLSLDDFVITQYNNSGVPTISTVVYGAISRRDIPDAFKALTAIIFVVILLVLVVMNLNAARIRKGIKISRKVTAVILAVVLLLATGGIIPVIVANLTPRELVLKIYNWEDYIEVELLDEFTESYIEELKANGVKNADKFRVEYHTFTDNEELYSKINTQHADYDIIFPSEYMVEKMASEGLIQPIDESRATDGVTLDSNILSRTAAFTTVYDENNQVQNDQVWAIPYMVGTVGIMYDVAVIDAMKDETNIDVDKFQGLLKEYGFGVLFGEGGTEAFSGRITMKKSARDSIGTAMIYAAQRNNDLNAKDHPIDENADYLSQVDTNGDYDNSILESIFNMDDGYTIDMARKVLLEQIETMHPFYENDNGKKSFMNPDDDSFAYGLFWSCDAGLAMMEAIDENDYDSLRYYAPKGTNLWTDNFAIPTYAKNLDAAYAFINFMLNDENAAVNIDYVGSQMVSTGTAIDDLKDEYGFVDSDDQDFDVFDEEINLAVAIFPTEENITYSAIMHNFDKSKEKSVNNLMLEIQNKAAESTENEGGTINWFLVAIIIFAFGGFAWWRIYKLTHQRPRKLPN
ncbi:MAG: extracellular solute-binding protein [Clostridia bacterium]|nr:extracellular solute-binding protein [Clostridia bacterium]